MCIFSNALLIFSSVHGVFNLGFVGVRNCSEGRRFARWWAQRLLKYCHDDLPAGLFTDQKWVNLAPCFSRELVAMDFDGYAVGGVSVGEPEDVLLAGVRDGVAELPEGKPRYLMGVGRMDQLLKAIAMGIDMFDCVMPTRYARNGSAFTRSGKVAVKAGRYRLDTRPVEPGWECLTCRSFSRAYVRHLLNVNEILGVRLLTLHNIHRYMEFMKDIRAALAEGTYQAFMRDALKRQQGDDE